MCRNVSLPLERVACCVYTASSNWSSSKQGLKDCLSSTGDAKACGLQFNFHVLQSSAHPLSSTHPCLAAFAPNHVWFSWWKIQPSWSFCLSPPPPLLWWLHLLPSHMEMWAYPCGRLFAMFTPLLTLIPINVWYSSQGVEIDVRLQIYCIYVSHHRYFK